MGAESKARAERARLSVVPDPQPLPITRFGGGGFRGDLLARGLRSTVKPFISVWSRVPLLPWPYFLVDYVGLALKPVGGTTFERVALPHCKAEIVTTPATEDRVIVYLHGGAFVVGGRFLHRQLISRIAERTRARVYSVEYRQLPHHPVSDSVTDALDAYKHVLASGVPASNVIVMGDSAGGYLTFQLALAAEREGLPMPAGLVAMSPLIDFDGTVKLAAPSAQSCALFPAGCFDGLGKVVLRAALRAGEAVVLPEPPSRGELARLPKTLIQASSAEMVYPDAESMTAALAAAGVDVELQVWDHQVHVFQAAAGLLPEADQALDEIASFADVVVPDGLWALEA
ncbi:MAG: alpha/beta hydrolase fold domain-containing protein [Nocardioidaceae bacterium]|nr:alpha/beta hydrolase fold domain-containing protein [Nocardioidaceae bacterium]